MLHCDIENIDDLNFPEIDDVDFRQIKLRYSVLS